MKTQIHFNEHYIPSEDAEGKCCIYLTENITSCKKLLVVFQNHVGSQPGIWSRSLCIDHGLNAGSMLPTLLKAASKGYGIAVLNPNANSYVKESNKEGNKGGGHGQKTGISSSASPAEHVITCWDEIIYPQTSASHIYLLGYGNGGSLAKDILLRQLAKDNVEMNRIKAIATIETSQLLEEDDPDDVKEFLSTRTINWDSDDQAPKQYRLCKQARKLGALCLSAGPLPETSMNVAHSIQNTLDLIFKFFNHVYTKDLAASAVMPASGNTINQAIKPQLVSYSQTYFAHEASHLKLSANEASVLEAEVASRRDLISGMQKLFSWRHNDGENGHGHGHDDDSKHTLGVKDFDLLKVVGKGAFGKVMLVRKKSEPQKGNIFAMKVLKKSVIAAKGQVEHTKSERDILFEVRHPFVVFLRFAFQSDEKLYLITDFYSGGSLFYHLRKSRAFSEARARFYAAELLLALGHLHSHQIIYRDLKVRRERSEASRERSEASRERSEASRERSEASRERSEASQQHITILLVVTSSLPSRLALASNTIHYSTSCD